MNFFSKLYDKVLGWSRHRHAQWYLGGLSFAESSFFPIPPDVMLAPMALARPERAWHFALITTLASVVGGVFGYIIGVFAFEMIEPLLQNAGYWHHYEKAVAWFEQWGFWAVFLAGFSPIPYKIFTISAGALGMPFLPFLVASTVGRGTRFYLVAGLMRWGGERMEMTLRLYIDRIGWVLILAVVIAYFAINAGGNG